MIFATVLIIATAGTHLATRNNPRHGARRSARIGMGIAIVVAGVTHLLNPTPFEQHLPDSVPAETMLVLATGVIEIALGAALLLGPTQRVGGQLLAAYLVAVFPANVYVALADIDVDGQPGGPYPWIRLPFQALFIAWAWWSTQPTNDSPDPAAADPPAYRRTQT